MEIKLVSVVIPTLNEENTLPGLLADLSKQTYKNFEIIVADANSTDNTRKIAEAFGAKITKGGLPSVGRNAGASIALGGVIVFIDSDVRFNSDFLEKALEEFESKRLDFAIPFFSIKHEKRRYRIYFWYANLYKSLMKYTRFPDGTGQLAIVRKDKFIEVGKYPSNFKVAEDTDLFWRAARKRGVKVGTIKVSFDSSTRRMEKIGLIWMYICFGFIGIFLFVGLGGNKYVQNLAAKMYGGFGKKPKKII